MLSLMKSRVEVRGGKIQQDRMIKDKRKSLDASIKSSYQSAKIKVDFSDQPIPALINPNKNKEDYDDKLISVGFEYGLTTGTVFEWNNTNTYWLIYLQDLTELAYFRGNIRRCKHTISWIDEKGNKKSTFAAVIGPVETRINSAKTENISYDIPNYSLSILIPKNKDTLSKFKRYTRFYLQDEEDNKVCWRIEATDSISTPGILSVTAVEYYQNDIKDNVEEKIADIYPIKVNNEESLIQGEDIIKPKFSYKYTYLGDDISEWSYDKKLPIKTTIDDKTITIFWDKSYSGNFDIHYGTASKTIIVESLF